MAFVVSSGPGMGAVWQKPESIACENDPQYSSENGQQIKLHFSQDPGNL